MKVYLYIFLAVFLSIPILTTAQPSQPIKASQTMSDATSESTNQNNESPYAEIKPAPEKYTAGAMISRTIDGLGYRYHWATKDLTETDLAYDPGNGAQNAAAVLEHVMNLSGTIVTTLRGEPNIRPLPENNLTTSDEIRHQTLLNLWEASEICRRLSDDDFEKLDVIFKRGERESVSPFWNMVNGPISDAIYHTGQLVSYRRSSGNPINPKVSVFRGKNRE